jgi:hypothetical protein
MNDEPLHTALDGNTDYVAALDRLCALAQHELVVFEKNFENTGFNSEARYHTLRSFLLADPGNRLLLLAHSTTHLVQYCPRMMMLLRQFGHSMHIHQTPPHLQQVSEPFAVADQAHYVRRFHFDDARGIFAQHDPQGARTLHARFLEMWGASHPGASATTLGL